MSDEERIRGSAKASKKYPLAALLSQWQPVAHAVKTGVDLESTRRSSFGFDGTTRRPSTDIAPPRVAEVSVATPLPVLAPIPASGPPQPTLQTAWIIPGLPREGAPGQKIVESLRGHNIKVSCSWHDLAMPNLGIETRDQNAVIEWTDRLSVSDIESAATALAYRSCRIFIVAVGRFEWLPTVARYINDSARLKELSSVFVDETNVTASTMHAANLVRAWIEHGLPTLSVLPLQHAFGRPSGGSITELGPGGESSEVVFSIEAPTRAKGRPILCLLGVDYLSAVKRNVDLFESVIDNADTFEYVQVTDWSTFMSLLPDDPYLGIVAVLPFGADDKSRAWRVHNAIKEKVPSTPLYLGVAAATGTADVVVSEMRKNVQTNSLDSLTVFTVGDSWSSIITSKIFRWRLMLGNAAPITSLSPQPLAAAPASAQAVVGRAPARDDTDFYPVERAPTLRTLRLFAVLLGTGVATDVSTIDTDHLLLDLGALDNQPEPPKWVYNVWGMTAEAGPVTSVTSCDCLVIFCPMPSQPSGHAYDAGIATIRAALGQLVAKFSGPNNITNNPVIAAVLPSNSASTWHWKTDLPGKLLVLHENDGRLVQSDVRTLIEVATDRGPNRVAIMVDPLDTGWPTRDKTVAAVKKAASDAKWEVCAFRSLPSESISGKVIGFAAQAIGIASGAATAIVESMQDRIGTIVVIMKESTDTTGRCKELIAAATKACATRTTNRVIVSIAYFGELSYTADAALLDVLKKDMPSPEYDISMMPLRHTKKGTIEQDAITAAGVSAKLGDIAARIASGHAIF